MIAEITGIETELQSIENESTHGIILRSKIKWAEDNEKNTTFFLNLEKNNYTNKLITQLNINGKMEYDPKLILNEEKVFMKHYIVMKN